MKAASEVSALSNTAAKVDKQKAEALLKFVVALGIKGELAEVDNLNALAARHVPMLAAMIYTKQMACIATSVQPLEAYQKAKEVLIRSGSSLLVDECLDEKKASENDEFEICKFLLALLNEIRSSYPSIFGNDPFMSSHLNSDLQNQITIMLNYLDDADVCDSVSSWPSILREHGTPRTPECKVACLPELSCANSLVETMSTPLARTNKKLHENELKVKGLTELLNAREAEFEDLQKRTTELEIANKELNTKVEKLLVANNEFNKLNVENALMSGRLQGAQQEVGVLESLLSEKREQLAKSENYVNELVRSYESLREETEQLRNELNRKLTQNRELSAAAESSEAEARTLRTENTELKIKLLSVNQTFERAIEELKYSWELEKGISRKKMTEYEDALAAAYTRAQEMSAKLCMLERKNKDRYRQNILMIANRLLQMKSMLREIRTDVYAMNDHLMSEIAACCSGSTDETSLQDTDNQSSIENSDQSDKTESGKFKSIMSDSFKKHDRISAYNSAEDDEAYSLRFHLQDDDERCDCELMTNGPDSSISPRSSCSLTAQKMMPDSSKTISSRPVEDSVTKQEDHCSKISKFQQNITQLGVVLLLRFGWQRLIALSLFLNRLLL